MLFSIKPWLSPPLKVISFFSASLVAQMVKNLPALLATRVQSLGQEEPLEKGMAAHSSIPAWRIPWTEEPGRLQVHRITKSQTRLSNSLTHTQAPVSTV